MNSEPTRPAAKAAVAPKPAALKLRRGSRVLEVTYADGRIATLPFEYLRVFSPSAEVRGHGDAEPKLMGGKRDVVIERIEPVGAYAVRLVFSDGHDSGLYAWGVLHELAEHYARNWARYLQRLADARMSRDRDVVTLAALAPQQYQPRDNLPKP